MHKSLWIVMLLCAAIGAPSARGDIITDYTITFAGGTPNPTSGTFEYDSTANQFTDFQVVFDGTTFDLTAAANSPILVGTPSCITGTGAQAAFQLLTSCATDPAAQWQGTNAYDCCSYASFGFELAHGVTDYIRFYENIFGSNNSANAFTQGTFTSTSAVAVPEPSTVSLLGIFLALLGVFRAVQHRHRVRRRLFAPRVRGS